MVISDNISVTFMSFRRPRPEVVNLCVKFVYTSKFADEHRRSSHWPPLAVVLAVAWAVEVAVELACACYDQSAGWL